MDENWRYLSHRTIPLRYDEFPKLIFFILFLSIDTSFPWSQVRPSFSFHIGTGNISLSTDRLIPSAENKVYSFSATLPRIRQPFPVVPPFFPNGFRGGGTAPAGVTARSVRGF
jgi:hypothetical protein